jgi:hypothetical protein
LIDIDLIDGNNFDSFQFQELLKRKGGRRDRMAVGFTTTNAIGAYHH